MDESIVRLKYLCEIVPVILRNIPDEEFCKKPEPDEWSKKEIFGHLLDSAANNHHRFIRSQFENVPYITYDPNNWNRSGNYSSFPTEHLISFWTVYNLHLVRLVESFTEETLAKRCGTDGEIVSTLGQIFVDYVAHLEHHLKQLADYE